MNRIKELRKQKELTLKQLGIIINVGANTISRYENGKREPKLETWQALADFFQVPVAYLKGITNSKESYSKDYIYNQLLSGYNNDWQEIIDDIPEPQLISLRIEVDNYLEKNKIKKPNKLTLDFVKENFSFIFSDNNIKRLLTTKDSYSDDEIKELISTAIFLRTLPPKTSKKVNNILENRNK